MNYEAHMSSEDEAITGTQLGLERWVQFAFIGFALVIFWFCDHLFAVLGEVIAMKMNAPTPPAAALTGGAALVGIFGALMLYRNPRIQTFSNDVADELSRVVWPSKPETWDNTVTVFVVALVAAMIVGAFDAAWSAITGILY